MTELSTIVTSLDRLPITVLTGIVEALCPHCTPDPTPAQSRRYWSAYDGVVFSSADTSRTQSLAALARCSWTLNNVATPALYHQPKARLSLIRSLDQKPELCRHITNLYFDNAVGNFNTPSEQDKSMLLRLAANHSPAQLQILDENHGGLRAAADWLEEDTDLFLEGLLIAMCPRIRDLFVPCGSGAQFPLSKPGTLPRLEHLHIAHTDTELGTTVRRAASLLAAAPNLNRFWGYMINCTSNTEDLSFDNLTELRFVNSCFGRSSLLSLLRACPILESFSYEAGGPCSGDLQFSARDAQTALVRYAPSLKYLELSMGHGERMWHMNDWDSDPGSDDDTEEDEDDYLSSELASLSSLEVLNIDGSCLPPDWADEDPSRVTTIIPSTVKEVTMHPRPGCGWEGRFRSILRNLAEGAPILYPNLAIVRFGGTSQNFEAFTKQEREEILEATGVDMRAL
jgi:hypothetical protein